MFAQTPPAPAAPPPAEPPPAAAPPPEEPAAPVAAPEPQAPPSTPELIEPAPAPEPELTAEPEPEVRESGEGDMVVVGSRVKPRSDTESPSPVDVLSAQDLLKTGTTEVGRALQMLAPSFNFATTTISDGTDLIRPATLRGLGPDQVLVLVNGKRRHQIALVNVQETIGK
ncbi:MAG TPA: TonB-dependent receptor plug domain-containing protein, partial [Polyangiales bacterium]|nr:TonB-dependent receptor plug domain-containing protein [Polyangiales bacterium]